MSDVAQLYPHVPLLKTPVQEPLPRADGTCIVWQEPRRLLFRRIVRSDGSIVDFQRARITESIRSALSKVGHGTDHVEELTDRVIIFLANRFDDRLLSTAEVALTVETTLLHSGLAESAEAYAAQRRQRPLRVDGSDGTRWPWDRARIVSALRRETNLDLALAEEIARDVDAALQQAPTARSADEMKPVIRRFAIAENPVKVRSRTRLITDVLDPVGAKLYYEWRFGWGGGDHGGIERDQDGNFYYYADTRQAVEELTLFVLNDWGFCSWSTIQIQVVP